MEKNRRLQTLLENAVRQICVAELGCKNKVRAQCLLGLTSDDAEVVLVQIDEILLEKPVGVECSDKDGSRRREVIEITRQPNSFHGHADAPLNASAIEVNSRRQDASFEDDQLVSVRDEMNMCLDDLGLLDVGSSTDDNVLGTIEIESYGNYESLSTEVRAELMNQWPYELAQYQKTVPVHSSAAQHSMMPIGCCQHSGYDWPASKPSFGRSKRIFGEQMNGIPTAGYGQHLSNCGKGRKIGKSSKSVYSGAQHSMMPRGRRQLSGNGNGLPVSKASYGRSKCASQMNFKSSPGYGQHLSNCAAGKGQKMVNLKQVFIRRKVKRRKNSKKNKLPEYDGLFKREVQVKRKPGRPKKKPLSKDDDAALVKVKTEVTEPRFTLKRSPSSSGVSVPPCKRGWLKKKFLNLHDTGLTTQVQVIRKRGRPKKSLAAECATIRRSRGRPKKKPIVSSPAPSFNTTSTVFKKLKVEITELPKNVMSSTGVAMASVNGAITVSQEQPMNSVIDSSPSATKVGVVTLPMKIKRKPGRPKKILLAEGSKVSLANRKWRKKHLTKNFIGPALSATSTAAKEVQVLTPKLPIKAMPTVGEVGVAVACFGDLEYSREQPEDSSGEQSCPILNY